MLTLAKRGTGRPLAGALLLSFVIVGGGCGILDLGADESLGVLEHYGDTAEIDVPQLAGVGSSLP